MGSESSEEIKESLLERRIRQRAEMIKDALEAAQRLDACFTDGYSDLHRAICWLKETSDRAVRYSQSVEDLSDVEKYGRTGGR